MKKISIILTAVILALFALFALGSSEESAPAQDNSGTNQETQKLEATVEPTVESAENEENGMLGDYKIVIDSIRMAKSYDDKPVVIVKYIYTNVNDDDATSFMIAFEDQVYQAGVGLNEAILLSEDYEYSSDNQLKEIKKGATIEVEVAYELNDTTTDIEVEISKLISFSDEKVTRVFSIVE